jgi:hypothetical protein
MNCDNMKMNLGEVYLLLIGDHGGGSFKLLLQDITRRKPNSPFNGFIVGEMDGPETLFNLKRAFGSMQVSRKEKKKPGKKKKKQNKT